MQIQNLPFCVTDCSQVDLVTYKGERGEARWRTHQFGDIRVRMVEYTPGYIADHWCEKGHVLLCLAGELTTQLKDGRVFVLKAGVSYQVADHAEAHRSMSEIGATLFIVD